MPRELQPVDRGMASHEAHDRALDSGVETQSSQEVEVDPGRVEARAARQQEVSGPFGGRQFQGCDRVGGQGGGMVLVQRHPRRSEEHTSELQSLMRISYAVFCLKKKTTNDRR